VRRIEALAKRLAKLEAIKQIGETPIVLEFHRGSMTLLPSELHQVLRSIDGKTRGIPHGV
jgi:hypothetical protein